MSKIWIRLSLFAFLFSACGILWCQSNAEQPHYQRATYAGESVRIGNSELAFRAFRRISGWGWGELYSGDGSLLGVLEHFGEIKLRDQDIPVRLESSQVRQTSTDSTDVLQFDVTSVVVRDMLKNTSFDVWMRYPFTEPALTGVVKLSLYKNRPLLHLQYDLISNGNYYTEYIRGPWLKVGMNSFGVEKDDALLPGVDWAFDREWTSGQDWFKDPRAMRVVPHPNKVTIPLMAISRDGLGIGMSWNANKIATRWFNYRGHRAQPVFASPNFVDRSESQLMRIMVPDARVEGHENEVLGRNPLELKIGQRISFDAKIWLSKGNCIAVLVDWLKRTGLPMPSPIKVTYTELLDSIANAYNTNFWHQGAGFGVIQRKEKKISPSIPSFLPRYIRDHPGSTLARHLQEKLDWCRQELDKRAATLDLQENLRKRGDDILDRQRGDGSFGFDPGEIGKDDFKVAASFIEPMGVSGEVALDVVIRPARTLLEIGKRINEDKYLKAARRSLDFCLEMKKPEGGDFWETPLHAPNLLAAGNAANTYYLAYQQFGDERYRTKAIYWMRTLLVFTHLWEPTTNSLLYNTKPLLGSSDWVFRQLGKRSCAVGSVADIR